MTALAIGFIGVGGIAPMHAAGMKARPDLFRLAAVADVNPKGTKTFADDFGIPDRYEDYRRILADPHIDAVIVLLPHFLHEQSCVAALSAGKHVLVEKPIARTLEETDRIVAAAHAAKRVLLVGHNQRYDPRHRKIRDMIDSGEFGKLFCARADHYQNFSPPAGSWWRSREAVGGGCVIGSGIHRLDLLRWYLGEVDEVYTALTYDKSRLEAEVCAVSTIRYRSGATAEFLCNWGVPRSPVGESLGIWGVDRSVTILSNEDPGQVGGPGWELSPLVAEQTPSMWEHFHDCITKGAAPLTSAAEGRAVLELVLAIVRSGEIRKPVSLASQ